MWIDCLSGWERGLERRRERYSIFKCSCVLSHGQERYTVYEKYMLVWSERSLSFLIKNFQYDKPCVFYVGKLLAS